MVQFFGPSMIIRSYFGIQIINKYCLINTNIKYSGMSKKEIANFIQYYEKITKWMFKVMPKLADIVLYVNSNQKISKIKKTLKK